MISTGTPLRERGWRPRMRRAVWAVTDIAARAGASRRVLPDYLVIGAQRAGTTSLQQALAGHPDVRPPRLRKGVHYFDTGFDHDVAWYRAQFPLDSQLRTIAARTGRRPLTGEASPYYLFHPLVPERIAGLLPETKMIALLRDPVERAISHHKHEVRRGFEQLDLAAALDAEPGRLAGEVERMRADPGYVSLAHQHHSYVARGRYAEQIARYLDRFPPDRLLVLESEAVWEDPESAMAEVLSFLDLPDWRPEVFPRANATRPSPVDPGLRRRLEEEFEAPNARLVEMLGRRFRWT